MSEGSVTVSKSAELDLALPMPDAVLAVNTKEMAGFICAGLTPLIKSKLREMESGQVLEIQVDDATARLDVPAWCRLSGNILLAMVEEGEEHTRFYLGKR